MFLNRKNTCIFFKKFYNKNIPHGGIDKVTQKDKKICAKIKEISLEIFEHIGAQDIARIDYRVTEKGEIYFLEINSVPRISSTSECAIICSEHNIPFKKVLMEYIDTINNRFINHEKK